MTGESAWPVPAFVGSRQVRVLSSSFPGVTGCEEGVGCLAGGQLCPGLC